MNGRIVAILLAGVALLAGLAAVYAAEETTVAPAAGMAISVDVGVQEQTATVNAGTNTQVAVQNQVRARVEMNAEANVEGNALRKRVEGNGFGAPVGPEANITARVGARGEMNVGMGPASGSAQMRGEMNAEGNAIRQRAPLRAAGNEEVIIGPGMVRMGKSEVNGATIMVGSRMRIRVEQNAVVLEEGSVQVVSRVRLKLGPGGKLISAESNAPIEVEPERAVQLVQERVRAKVVKKVELVDNGNGPVYVVEAEKPGKLLGIIPVDLTVTVEVNAESGQLVGGRAPWWSFLVFG